MVEKTKILVAYFSHSGNTRALAEKIRQGLGADIFEIKTIDAYPSNYNAVVDQARKEKESGRRPALAAKLENLAFYDSIFLGYPNWWHTIPMALASFLAAYDFAGKALFPFCTHGGGGLGNSAQDIAHLAPKAEVRAAFSLSGSQVHNADKEIKAWLSGLGLAK